MEVLGAYGHSVDDLLENPAVASLGAWQDFTELRASIREGATLYTLSLIAGDAFVELASAEATQSRRDVPSAELSCSIL